MTRAVLFDHPASVADQLAIVTPLLMPRWPGRIGFARRSRGHGLKVIGAVVAVNRGIHTFSEVFSVSWRPTGFSGLKRAGQRLLRRVAA